MRRAREPAHEVRLQHVQGDEMKVGEGKSQDRSRQRDETGHHRRFVLGVVRREHHRPRAEHSKDSGRQEARA